MTTVHTDSEILEFYRRPGPMTSGAELGGMAKGLAEITRMVQGVILHLHIAPEYGEHLSDERREEAHIRSLGEMARCALQHNNRPLSERRSTGDRIIGTCRDFTVMAVALLRQAGVAARARCGFGMYFDTTHGVDHWVVEYWNADESRWALADAQLDELQRGLFKPEFDVLDVPRDRFLVAGDAWAKCRRGEADPALFGIMDMSGLGFIAGNIVRDVAALNGVEMLPWDCWGAMPRPGEELTAERLAYFDRLAQLTHEPDRNFEELRRAYEADAGLKVPGEVFNAVAGRVDAVPELPG